MAYSVYSPKNTEPITKMWAIVSRDADGNEGVVAANGEMGTTPLVATTEKLRDVLITIMKRELPKISNKDDKTFHLVEFSEKRDIEAL